MTSIIITQEQAREIYALLMGSVGTSTACTLLSEEIAGKELPLAQKRAIDWMERVMISLHVLDAALENDHD